MASVAMGTPVCHWKNMTLWRQLTRRQKVMAGRTKALEVAHMIGLFRMNTFGHHRWILGSEAVRSFVGSGIV